MTQYLPPLIHCKRIYCILIHIGKGRRGGELAREKVRRATVHKAGSKIPTVYPVFKI
jgi:hypothetical protein